MAAEQPSTKRSTRSRSTRTEASQGVRAVRSRDRRQVSHATPTVVTGGVGLTIATIFRDAAQARLNAATDIANALAGSTPGFAGGPVVSLPALRLTGAQQLAQRMTSPLQSSPSAIEETADSYIVTFELPGWGRDDLDVQVDPAGLTISGERPTRMPSGPGFEQDAVEVLDTRWTAPEDIEPADAKASLTDGVLEVVIPKAEEVRSRHLSIS